MVHLRPLDYFAERPFGGREIALRRPQDCHDTQILGVVDRIGDEAAQRSERVQVVVRQVQLATQGADLRARPQRQRLERTIARCLGPLYRFVGLRHRAVESYHATAYWEKWVSSAATRFPAGSSLDGSCSRTFRPSSVYTISFGLDPFSVQFA